MQEIEAANASYQRMYQLIRQTGPIGDRRFEIEFRDAGVEAFVFTFGSQEGMGHYV
jgi:Thioredoxin like C-terminal domain